jgi:hypothetical protein
MESEQKTSLKSVTSRIDIEDYAKLIEAMCRWNAKDMSSLIRKIIHDHMKDIQLDQSMLAWVEEQRTKDAERRAKNATNKTKRPSLLAKLFGFAK